jgi:hypothetical protein
MITTRYNHSLANQMFQYAFARILAERFGYRLKAEPLALFPETQRDITGNEFFGPKVCWYGNWPIDDDLQAIHPNELRDVPHAKLSLCGAFQRFEFFREDQDRIRRDWFRVNAIHALRPSSDFVVSMISAADADEGRPFGLPTDGMHNAQAANTTLNADSSLSNEEIRRLARSVPHDRLYILCDAAAEVDLKAEFKDLSPIVVSGGDNQDFLFLLPFQKIALSQNALHWWAAFLGSAREIFFPNCDRGYWSHPDPPVLAHEPAHHGIDLRADDPRFIYDW